MRNRFNGMVRHGQGLLTNHNNDPTGALGEDGPAYIPELQRYLQWIDSQASRNTQQQQHRENMREVQQEVGAVQPPLGPGNAILRSEIAAENPPQVRGPQELAAEMEVAAINDDSNQDQGDETNQQATGNRRRRRNISPNPGNGGGTRNNRRRVADGRTIQDEISEGRENLNNISNVIGNMAQAMAPQEAPRPQPFVDNPIGALESLQQNMLTVANNLGPGEVHAANTRLLHSWHGLLERLAQANNVQLPPAPFIPAAAAPLDGLDSDSD